MSQRDRQYVVNQRGAASGGLVSLGAPKGQQGGHGGLHSGSLLGAAPGRKRMVSLGKLAVPKPVQLPSQKKENAGNDPTTQLVPSGQGWNKGDAELQEASLVEKATWASGPPAAAAQQPAAAQQRSAWAQQAPRPLNPSEFPSLEAAKLGKPAPSATAHLSADATGSWEEDDRRVGGSREGPALWDSRADSRADSRHHRPGPPHHDRRLGEHEPHGYGARDEPQDWRYSEREVGPPAYHHDRHGPPRGRFSDRDREQYGGYRDHYEHDRSRVHDEHSGGRERGGFGPPRHERYLPHGYEDGPGRGPARYNGGMERATGGRMDRRGPGALHGHDDGAHRGRYGEQNDYGSSCGRTGHEGPPYSGVDHADVDPELFPPPPPSQPQRERSPGYDDEREAFNAEVERMAAEMAGRSQPAPPPPPPPRPPVELSRVEPLPAPEAAMPQAMLRQASRAQSSTDRAALDQSWQARSEASSPEARASAGEARPGMQPRGPAYRPAEPPHLGPRQPAARFDGSMDAPAGTLPPPEDRREPAVVLVRRPPPPPPPPVEPAPAAPAPAPAPAPAAAVPPPPPPPTSAPAAARPASAATSDASTAAPQPKPPAPRPPPPPRPQAAPPPPPRSSAVIPGISFKSLVSGVPDASLQSEADKPAAAEQRAAGKKARSKPAKAATAQAAPGEAAVPPAALAASEAASALKKAKQPKASKAAKQDSAAGPVQLASAAEAGKSRKQPRQERQPQTQEAAGSRLPKADGVKARGRAKGKGAAQAAAGEPASAPGLQDEAQPQVQLLPSPPGLGPADLGPPGVSAQSAGPAAAAPSSAAPAATAAPIDSAFGWSAPLAGEVASLQLSAAAAAAAAAAAEDSSAMELPPTLDQDLLEPSPLEAPASRGLQDMLPTLPADLSLDTAVQPAVGDAQGFGLPPPRTAASPPPFPGGLFPMPVGSWQPQAPPQEAMELFYGGSSTAASASQPLLTFGTHTSVPLAGAASSGAMQFGLVAAAFGQPETSSAFMPTGRQPDWGGPFLAPQASQQQFFGGIAPAAVFASSGMAPPPPPPPPPALSSAAVAGSPGQDPYTLLPANVFGDAQAADSSDLLQQQPRQENGQHRGRGRGGRRGRGAHGGAPRGPPPPGLELRGPPGGDSNSNRGRGGRGGRSRQPRAPKTSSGPAPPGGM